MTTRTLISVTADDLELLAFNSGADIEIDTARDCAVLTLGATTFVADLPSEVCS